MIHYAVRGERIPSIAVGVAVIGALVVSTYQANLARAPLRVSARPFVQQWNAGPSNGNPYRRVMSNQGIGPARVQSERVLVDDRPAATWNGAIRALRGEGRGGDDLFIVRTRRGAVGGRRAHVPTIPAGARAESVRRQARARLRTVTCDAACTTHAGTWTARRRSR